MKNIRRAFISLLTLIISFVFVPAAFAHPLGNFTINHYAGLQVSPDSISIDYVLDMAEIPAFQEITAFDANGNGQADSAEAAGYHADKMRFAPAGPQSAREQQGSRLNPAHPPPLNSRPARVDCQPFA